MSVRRTPGGCLISLEKEPADAWFGVFALGEIRGRTGVPIDEPEPFLQTVLLREYRSVSWTQTIIFTSATTTSLSARL